MREIKFRAWFPDDKWYHDGMLYDWQDCTGIESHCFVPPEETGIVIMQYTGLKDKNGVEIYESDVRKDGARVKWNNLRCGWYWFNKNGYCVESLTAYEYDSLGNRLRPRQSLCEVIGNIYENPELL